MASGKSGSVIIAMLWMTFLSLILCWIPMIGALVAGLVGGKKAGGIMAAIVAVFLPAILIGILMFAFTSVFTGIPGMGVLAGLGVSTLTAINVGPLLIGAIVGAILSK